MPESINFEEDVKAPTLDLLHRITAACAEREAVSKSLAELNAKASALAKEVDTLETRIIPDLMNEAGIRDFTLKDGRKVAVEQEIYCSISKPNAPTAFKWLRDHNYDSIIKRLIGVQFGKGDDQLAKQLRERLAAEFGERLQVLDNETVHPSTLKAFVKEVIADGVAIPETPFGIYKINRATIKEQK